MQRYASVVGAIQAGKIPSQGQLDAAAEWLLKSPLMQIESIAGAADGASLSQNGQQVVQGVRAVLEAYKRFSMNKNGDDVLQEIYFNLSHASLKGDVVAQIDDATPSQNEAISDAEKFAEALRTLIRIPIANITEESTSIVQDITSLIRMVLADTAEHVEERAGDAKETLRTVDDEVKEGKRDVLGRKVPEDDDFDKLDVQKAAERTADAARDAADHVMGVGEDVKTELKGTSMHVASESINRIVRQSQDDPLYHHSLETVFDLVRKWYTQFLHTAQSAELHVLVEDPTGRISAALSGIRTFVERMAGGKSLDALFDAAIACVEDIRQDKEIQQFVDECLSYGQLVLDDSEYLHSAEGRERRRELGTRFSELKKEGGETKAKWVGDLRRIGSELDELQAKVNEDEDLKRVREAHAKLAQTVQVATADPGPAVAAANPFMGGGGSQLTSWIWQDVMNVYIPRLFSMLKDIPVPRTEFTSPDFDFVLSNVDIASLSILPGHACIRQSVELDVSKESLSSPVASSTTGNLSVRLQGVQLALREISFYYEDKKSWISPRVFQGLVDFVLPEEGIDIDISLTVLPVVTEPERLEDSDGAMPGGWRDVGGENKDAVEKGEVKEDEKEEAKEGFEKKGRFFKVDYVKASISENVQINVKQSNHPILVSLSRGIVRVALRSALATAIQENVGMLFTSADALSYRVYTRAQVLQRRPDMTRGKAYASALGEWIQEMQEGPGMLTGARFTGAGVVKDRDENGEEKREKFAVGVAPMIVGGEKGGPEPERAPLPEEEKTVAESKDDKEADKEEDGGVGVEEGVDGVKAGLESVSAGVKWMADESERGTFGEKVGKIREEEEKVGGWRSDCFDVYI